MGAMRIMSAGILSADHEVGDVTIGWTSEHDADMAALIQRKMDQGVRFFIVSEPLADERTQLQRVQDIQDRKVVIGDEDVQRMFTEGRIGFFRRIRQGISSMRRTTSAQEAAQSHTWAMRQPAGV